MRKATRDRIERALQVALVNAVLGNERIARQFGLRVTDFQTLHLLVLRDDLRTPTQLTEISGLPSSTVTRVLDRLENAGYLRRVHDPSDRRRINVELVMERIDPIIERYREYGERLSQANAGFSDEELNVVARYLEETNNTF